MALQTFNTFLQNASVLAALVLLMTLSGESAELTQGRQPGAQNHTAVLDNSTIPKDALDMPKVLSLQRSCRDEHKEFCVNGDCHYTPDVNTPSCSCPSTHNGERCEHLLLKISDSRTSPEEIIGICLGLALLLGCVSGGIYCCVKKRCKRETLPYKTYNGKEDV